jgi:hypothetical protein
MWRYAIREIRHDVALLREVHVVRGVMADRSLIAVYHVIATNLQ